MTLSCICGQVHLTLEHRPEYINACNCSLCGKAGARWGYFHPRAVAVEGETRGFRRADKGEPNTELHFCAECGATTHFVLTEHAVGRFGNVQMGVNMGLASEAELAGIEMRYPDGEGWSGSGPFGYVREARIIGA